MHILKYIHETIHSSRATQMRERERERLEGRWENRFLLKMSGITFHSSLIFNQGVFILLVHYRSTFRNEDSYSNERKNN